MNRKKEKFHFHIGMRTIKTSFAATICALFYLIFGRNPTFACIGAIFGLGSDMESSFLNGGNRFYGTMIGGILGMGLFRLYLLFYPDGKTRPLMLLLLFIGVVILIITSQFFYWPGAVQPGGVVLCIILFNTPVDTYITYSLNRILDTGIGVAVSILINYILPDDQIRYVLYKLKLRKEP